MPQAAQPIAIGTVAELTGTAQAQNPVTGEVRDLNVGDMVYAHEVIITSDGSNIVLSMGDGSNLAIGEGSELALNAESIGGERFASLTEEAAEDAGQGAVPSVEVIGTVVALSGNAEAKNPITGETRVLKIGDQVFADEIVITADGSAIAIEFKDGSRLDLGRNSEIALDTEVFNPAILATLDLPGTTAQSSQDQLLDALINDSATDIDAIQQALLAGEDPSQLEATAAGPGAGGGGEEEGSSFVLLERSDQATTPDSGFNTDPIAPEFPPVDPEDPPVEEEAPVDVENLPVTAEATDSEINEAHLNGQFSKSQGTDPGVLILQTGGEIAVTGDSPVTVTFPDLSSNSGLTSNGLPILFRVSEDGRTLTAYTESGESVGNTGIESVNDNLLDLVQQFSECIIFTVVLNPTEGGNWTYTFTLNDQIDHVSGETNLSSLGIGFPVDVEDGNGDRTSTSFTVTVIDDEPQVRDQADPISSSVEEDGMSLATGDNSEGNKEDGDSNSDDEASGGPGSLGALFISGADETLTFGLSENTDGLPALSSNGVPVTYEVVGDTLTASAGDNTVFTLTVNEDGSWNFDLQGQLDHVDDGTNSENTDLVSGEGSAPHIDFSSIITAMDADNDPAGALPNGSFVLSVVDDIPSIDVAAADRPDTSDDVLRTGDTNLDGLVGTANFANNFSVTSDHGADGAGSVTTTYSLAFTAAASGLTTAAGDAITLTGGGDEIVGMADGSPAFTISLNTDTGAVTVTQHVALQHADDTDHDEDGGDGETGPLTMAAELISITQSTTITDADGDSATDAASINIGGSFEFTDDGPTVDVSAASQPDTSDDVLRTGDTNLDGLVGTANFANNFSVTSDHGADGAGSVTTTYSLAFTAAASGLTTAAGDAITLTGGGDEIVGMADGSPAFTISLNTDTGAVTVTQHVALQHADDTDHDEDGGDGETGPLTMAAELISITQSTTITDADGDSATDAASINIGGSFEFTDDGPTVDVSAASQPDTSDDVLRTGDTNLDGLVGTANFANNFSVTSDHGADGAGSVTTTYSLAFTAAASGLTTAAGDAITLTGGGDEIVGMADGSPAFTISLNTDTGAVTVTQHVALQHADDTDHDEDGGDGETGPLTMAAELISITQSTTITDADGDSATDAASINIGGSFEFTDDGPTVDVSAASQPDTSDDVLRTGDTNLDGLVGTANFANNFSVTSDHGADGAGSVTTTYSLAFTAAASGLTTAAGDAITLTGGGDEIVGMADGSPAFTISLNTDTGAVTVTQHVALQHADDTDHDEDGGDGETGPLTMAAELISITQSTTITDADGDSATDAASINIGGSFEFTDDGPTVDVSAASQPDTSDDVLRTGDTNLDGLVGTANFANNFSVTSDHGADGAGSVTTTYSLAFTAAASGLTTAAGDAITLTGGGDEIVGMADGSPAFTISLNTDTGAVTVTQHVALQHVDNTDHDEDGGDGETGPLTMAAELISITQSTTITDADGDSATDAASINIGGSFEFTDDGPTVDVSAASQPDTSDDVLRTGDTNLDGLVGTANFANNFSVTSDHGADGAGSVTTTYSLAFTAAASGLTTAAGDAITLTGGGDEIVGMADGSPAFTISLNTDTGAVTVTQHVALQHADDTDHDEDGGDGETGPLTMAAELISITQSTTITDADGDSATDAASINIGGSFEFTDDGPSITVKADGLEGDSLTVDESNLATNATADFSDNFDATTSSYGADGAGNISTSYSLGISAAGAASGLTDVATGSAVTLHMNGGAVEGRTSTGDVVFTVSVNAAGTVTLDQVRALQHPTGGASHDESVSLSAADLVTLTRSSTITDKDGDTDTTADSIDIGQALNFKDDGPSITVKADGLEGDSLTVDESNLATNATADFSDNFDATTSSYGADGAGSISTSYSLGISAAGAASGLTDVATGSAVTLHMNGGAVEGRTSTGDVVFTVSVNAAGTVTLDQVRALQHPTGGASHDESVSLSAADLVTLTRSSTITDKDGDTDTTADSIDIGQALNFKDDGPSITVKADGLEGDSLTVDESNLATNATADFSDNFDATTSSYGADGAGSISTSYSLGISAAGAASGLTDVATGSAVTLHMNGGAVEGRTSTGDVVFTVSVNAAGTVTLDQVRALQHPTGGASHDESVSLSAADLVTLTRSSTITDKDGDTDTTADSIDIGQALNFKDDGPSITVKADGLEGDSLTVDESNLATNATADFSDNFDATTSSYGADGAGSISTSYSLGISAAGAASGLTDVATGSAVTLHMNGGAVEGRTSTGDVVFTVSVNAAGTVTLDQVRALQHPTGGASHDESVSLSAADLVTLTRSSTITDKDGDTDTTADSIDIGQALNFKDDGPSITVKADGLEGDSLTVDESNLATNATADFSDNFDATTSSYGADGAGNISTSYSLGISAAGAASGLTDVATGSAVTLHMNGGAVEGRTSTGDVVFTVSVNAAGTVTLDQVRALQHPTGGASHDESVSLSAADLVTLTRSSTITDKDGDTDTTADSIDIGQALNFKDDGPSITVKADGLEGDSLTVDESNLATNATADFSDNFDATTSSYGADGAGNISTSYSLGISAAGAASGLTDVATGSAVTLHMNGGAVEGRTSTGDVVFTVSVNAAGTVTLDQVRALQHPTGGASHDESVSLSAADLVTLTRSSTITDKDGDTDTTADSIDIGQALNFKDDGPSITVKADGLEGDSLTVDESNLATNATADFSDNFDATTSSYGADGAGSISTSYSLGISAAGAASGLTDVATGSAVTLHMNGGAVEGRTSTGDVVFTVSVNAAGTVTLDQVRALQHPTGGASHDESVSLSAADLVTLTRSSTITDKDGDTDTTADSIDIGQALNFKDDGPSITVKADGLEGDSLTVDESNLATNATADFSDNFDATTSSYGADGAGNISTSYSLGISAAGAASGLTDVATGSAVTLHMNGGAVEGRTSTGDVVFTVSVNAAGTVTLDQVRALQHPTGGASHDESVSLSAADLVTLTRSSTITDKDGDTDTTADSIDIGQALNFKDDGPSITVKADGLEGDSLTVDESNLATNATADFSDNFDATTSSYGADGAGNISTSYSLGISAAGAASGLTDVATGSAVTLHMNGGAVEGRTSTGDVVFTVSVNAAGTVTLDQVRALQHPTGGASHDESVSLSAADLVTLTRSSTITDKDGDTDTTADSIDIGQALNFKDDGPSITVKADGLEGDSLTVDESNLATNATADFSDNFDATTSSYGADGAGNISTSYSLGISAAGAASGLTDVATGSAVTLHMNGGAVEGRTSTGDVVFTVSVNAAGTVTLDQVRALQHPTGGASHDESVSLSAADLVTLTRSSTITDKDGDTDTTADSIDIGQALNFKDDGPSVIAPEASYLVNQVGQSVSGKALDIDGNIHDNIGADQLGSVRFTAGNGSAFDEFTSGNSQIYLYVSEDGQTLIGSTHLDVGADASDADVLDSKVFTVALNTDGSLALSDDTYSFTLHQTIDGGATSFKVTDSGYSPLGGNTAHVLYDDPDNNDENGEQDVLLSAFINGNASTVNSSNIYWGVGQGNSVDPGEILRVDYVNGLTGTPSAPSFTAHNQINGATATFGQTTGSTVRIKAFDNNNNTVGNGSGSPDKITGLKIIYNGVESALILIAGTTSVTVGGNTFTITESGNEVTVANVKGVNGNSSGARTEIITYTADGFSSIEYQYEAGSGSNFKVGAFGASVPVPGEQLDLNFELAVVDADGDSVAVPDGISVSLSPEGYILQEGTDGIDVLSVADGTLGTLVGHGGDDMLTGNSGVDILLGGDGNDTIAYDAGDTIDGGTGMDTLLIDGSMSGAAGISNIEKLDLTDRAGDTDDTDVVTLSAADVISMTDGGNLLTIVGEATDGGTGDQVNLTGGTWGTGADLGNGFIAYSDGTVTVQVQDDINVTLS